MSPTLLPEETKSIVTITIDPKCPNRAWISEEPRQYQSKVKEFLDFMKHYPAVTGPVTFSLSAKLTEQDASGLEAFFDVYRDTFELPRWLKIKVK